MDKRTDNRHQRKGQNCRCISGQVWYNSLVFSHRQHYTFDIASLRTSEGQVHRHDADHRHCQPKRRCRQNHHHDQSRRGSGRTGYRVLLVDLDPQAALSYGVGIQSEICPARSTTPWSAARGPDMELIQSVARRLDVLPANIDLAAAEIELITAFSRESILRDVLAPLAPHYNFILIDCGPNLGLLTINALTAADIGDRPGAVRVFCPACARLIAENGQARAGAAQPPAEGGRHPADNVPDRHASRRRGAQPDQRVYSTNAFSTFRSKRAFVLPRHRRSADPCWNMPPNHEGAATYRTLAEVISHDSTER